MHDIKTIINKLRKGVLYTESGCRCRYSYTVMDKEDIFRSIDRADFIISIDHVDITVHIQNRYKIDYKKGYFGYYAFLWDGDRHSLYLPNDDVFDSKPFFTTSIIERRNFKLNIIINKLKTHDYEI